MWVNSGICRGPAFVGKDVFDRPERDHDESECSIAGVVTYAPPEFERTSMGWLIDPQGRYDIVERVAREAPGLTLYVTENGCAAEEYVNPVGPSHTSVPRQLGPLRAGSVDQSSGGAIGARSTPRGDLQDDVVEEPVEQADCLSDRSRAPSDVAGQLPG